MAQTEEIRMRRPAPPLRRTGVIGLAVAAPVVLLVTLWPTHLLMGTKPATLRGLDWLHARNLFEWLYWTRLEVLANVAMFVPPAMLLTFALGARRWWLAVGLCAAASASVELMQHVMPGRVSSPLDVVANSVGAIVGALLAAVIEAVVTRARRASARRAARRWLAADR